MPILALLGPFKGVFGPPVGSGAPGEPNFRNNQTDPIFLIPLSLLNLIYCVYLIVIARVIHMCLGS